MWFKSVLSIARQPDGHIICCICIMVHAKEKSMRKVSSMKSKKVVEFTFEYIFDGQMSKNTSALRRIMTLFFWCTLFSQCVFECWRVNVCYRLGGSLYNLWRWLKPLMSHLNCGIVKIVREIIKSISPKVFSTLCLVDSN